MIWYTSVSRPEERSMSASPTTEKPRDAIRRLKQEIDGIWLAMPADVEALQTRRGTKGYRLPVLVCGEENTRAFADALSVLRSLAADEAMGIQDFTTTIEAFVRSNLAVLRNWYGLDDSAAVVESVMPALREVRRRDDLVELVSALALYVGRLHWWVDTLVPWAGMSAWYEESYESQ
jgi:hypothetical protein